MKKQCRSPVQKSAWASQDYFRDWHHGPGAPRKGLAHGSYLPLGTMRATERNSGKPSTDEVDGPRICAQGLVVVHLVHGRLHVQIVGRTAHVEGGFKCQGTVAEHLGVSVS